MVEGGSGSRKPKQQGNNADPSWTAMLAKPVRLLVWSGVGSRATHGGEWVWGMPGLLGAVLGTQVLFVFCHR
jgi:hypothetical protein